MFLERTARLANRVAVAGMVFVVLVALSLVAVVERMLLTGTSDPPPDGEVVLNVPENTPRPAQAVPSRSRTSPAQTLERQVRTFMLAQRGPAAQQLYGTRPSRPPVVGGTRFSVDHTWALGTTAIPVPADRLVMPQVTLFVARWNAGRWELALAGSPEFTPLLRKAPIALVPAAEKDVLAGFSDADADSRSADGLMLPWRAGDAWTMTATAAGKGPNTRPLGSVAFRGGDGRVLAAGDGRLYRFCATASGGGLIMVVHSNGLATQYYQMTDVTKAADGAQIKQGDYLGRTGTARPCGGAPAGRPEVRFALRQGADDVPLSGLTIGGWTFQERAKPLVGWVERGVMQVMPGQPLANFGPNDVAPPENTVPPLDSPLGKDKKEQRPKKAKKA